MCISNNGCLWCSGQKRKNVTSFLRSESTLSFPYKVRKGKLTNKLMIDSNYSLLLSAYQPVIYSRFLPALLTAILTNHLAWVPTVMPNGQPPIKIFLEKHSSQSVDMLAKTHPYNPLWAQLGETIKPHYRKHVFGLSFGLNVQLLVLSVKTIFLTGILSKSLFCSTGHP